MMSITSTNNNPSRSKEIEEKISSLTESFHTTTDSVNKLQQTCANLLLDNTKHYQLDVLNRLDTIEKQVENFNHDGI
jgi:predicted transcriptional regulator